MDPTATDHTALDHAGRMRQRALALFLPVTAVLYIGCEALTPRGTDQVPTSTAVALRLLAIAGRHPAQLYAAGTLGLLGLGGVAVSYAAIACLVRGRGAALATIAALVGGVGAFCGALVNVLNFPNLAAAATAQVSRGAAAQVLVTSFSSGWARAFLTAYVVGQYVAPVLMGVALWRSRAVPRWLAVLFPAGLEVAQQASSAGPVVILYMLPFGVAMILLAARIWPAAARPADSGRDPAG
ncbi:MAG TPA: hypothetical protein VIZ00_17255, partial [Streptosporangiaceae bacterium]